MGNFYGNIKSNPRVSLIFDRTYSNRLEMEENMTIDKIYNGRYVLISYGEKEYITDPGTGAEIVDESKGFGLNYKIDTEEYMEEYNSTVWQKIWINTSDSELAVEKYIMIAKLNAEAPELELIADAPSDDPEEAVPHFDLARSTDLKYKFHVPMMWMLNSSANLNCNTEGFSKYK